MIILLNDNFVDRFNMLIMVNKFNIMTIIM